MAPLPSDSVFKGKSLLTQSGSLVDAETALADKAVIVCYFSAHWCPPCRQFTPLLKKFYEQLNGSSIAIIFVSSDRDEESMKSYFAEHGGYFAVQFSDGDLAEALQKNCQVSGIPKLAVVSKSGQMIHGDGRGDVASGDPEATFMKWASL